MNVCAAQTVKTRFSRSDVENMLRSQRESLNHEPNLIDQLQTAQVRLQTATHHRCQVEEALVKAEDDESAANNEVQRLAREIEKFGIQSQK